MVPFLRILIAGTVLSLNGYAESNPMAQPIERSRASQKDFYLLKAVWNGAESVQDLKTWKIEDLSGFKRHSLEEKDSITGKVFRWSGILLSSFLEKALFQLPLEKKAQVDLVILRNSEGGQVQIPRFLITKYPVILATHRGVENLIASFEAMQIILPWTSRPKMMSEGLPIETYFLSRVNQIELTSFHEKYSVLYLKRRSDPLAVRGEKMFVQNCVSCHEIKGGNGPSVVELAHENRALASSGHPKVKGVPPMDERAWRALTSYLEAFRGENPMVTGQPQALKH